MNKLPDVHTIAERYLRDLKRGHDTFYAPPNSLDIVALADTITERVVLMREDVPQYFVGFKTSGRPVFTHDIRLAMSHDSASLKLVEVLQRFKHLDIRVFTMPAAWFSNHQRG